jgi:hypothetical protein
LGFKLTMSGWYSEIKRSISRRFQHSTHSLANDSDAGYSERIMFHLLDLQRVTLKVKEVDETFGSNFEIVNGAQQKHFL